MKFKQTNKCTNIEILQEQEKYISSMEKINKALQQKKTMDFIYTWMNVK